MSALEDIAGLVDTMRARKGEMTNFEGLLTEISTALADIVNVMERPPHAQGIAAAISSGLQGLKFPAPEVTVNVPKAADVNVTVQPAQVVVMEAERPAAKGWKLQVTSRDGNGNIREITFKPEV